MGTLSASLRRHSALGVIGAPRRIRSLPLRRGARPSPAARGRMLASMHTRDRWFTTLIAAVVLAAIAIALLSTVPTLVIIAGVGIALVAVALGADSIWDIRNRRHPAA